MMQHSAGSRRRRRRRCGSLVCWRRRRRRRHLLGRHCRHCRIPQVHLLRVVIGMDHYVLVQQRTLHLGWRWLLEGNRGTCGQLLLVSGGNLRGRGRRGVRGRDRRLPGGPGHEDGGVHGEAILSGRGRAH